MNGRLVALAVGLLAMAAVLPQAWRHEAQAQQRPPQWEYKVAYFHGNIGEPNVDKRFEEQVNGLAAKSWEYVGLLATPRSGGARGGGHGGYVAFKRLKK